MIQADEEYTTCILVVDDEADLLPLIEFCLKSPNREITTCNTATGALELLKQRRFDVILSDVNMPEMDGLSLLTEITQHAPGTPVILITGFAQLELAISAIKLGAFDLVQKPFEFDVLRLAVRRAAEVAYLRKVDKACRTELEHMVAWRTEELLQTIRELELAKEVILNASDERDRFVATISHEMRTPMNGIVGPLEMLHDSDLTQEQRSYLGIAISSSERMLSLVNQMISLGSRAFSGIDHRTGHRMTPLQTP